MCFSTFNVLTLCYVLQGFPHTSVKGTGIGRALERQAAFFAFDLPVVKCGRGLRVDQILPHETFQNHLPAKTSETYLRLSPHTSAAAALLEVIVWEKTCKSHNKWICNQICLGNEPSMQNSPGCKSAWFPRSPRGGRLWILVPHLLVFEALAMDEEVAVSGQLSGHHLTDAHPAEAPPLLCQPSPTRVISGHDHRFHAHNVTVTEKERETERHMNGTSSRIGIS